jgi:hypothetical protein
MPPTGTICFLHSIHQSQTFRMKKTLPLLLFAFLAGCGSNTAVKTDTETSKEESNSVSSPAATNTASASPQGEGLVGYWKLSLEAYDDNSNGKLDEEERKKGISNRYSFRFNADGTCQIMDMFKGRYERKTEKGKDMLYVYRNRIASEETKDPPPDIYVITSFSKNEMVLLHEMDYVFWVFNRQ